MGRGRPECLSSRTRTCRLRRQDVSRHCWVWAARSRMRIDGDGGSRRDRSFQRAQGSTGSSSSRPEPTDLSLFEPRMQPAPQAQPKKGRNSQASSRRWQGNCCTWASPRTISCSPCCRCPWITCCWNTSCFKIGVIVAPLDLRLSSVEVIRALEILRSVGFVCLGVKAPFDFRELWRYRPAAAVRSEKSEPRAAINRVFLSVPPNARFPGRSGISTTPISRPLEL